MGDKIHSSNPAQTWTDKQKCLSQVIVGKSHLVKDTMVFSFKYKIKLKQRGRGKKATFVLKTAVTFKYIKLICLCWMIEASY